MLRLLRRLLWPLFIGLILTILILQNSSVVEQMITHKLVTALEKKWNVSIKAQSSCVNFFTGSFFLLNGKVVDKNSPSCSWNFEQAKIHVSPVAYILKKQIQLYVTINNITLRTSLRDGQLDVVNHIKKMIESSSADDNIAIQLVRLNNFDITMAFHAVPIQVLINGFFELAKKHNNKQKTGIFTGSMVVDNLDAFINKKPLLQKMHGLCTLKKDKITDDWVLSVSQHLGNIFFDSDRQYNLIGEWSAHKREFVLKDEAEGKEHLMCTVLENSIIQLKGALSPHVVANIGGFCTHLHEAESAKSLSINEVGGQCVFDFIFSMAAPLAGCSGSISAEKLSYKGLLVKRLAMTVTRIKDQQVQAAVIFEQEERKCLEGTIDWDIKHKRGQIHLSNSQPIKPFSGVAQKSTHLCWVIKPNHLTINATITQDRGIECTYSSAILNPVTNNYMAFKGTCVVINNEIIIDGKTPRGVYRLVIPYQPNYYLRLWTYSINDKKYVELVTKDENKRVLEGFVHFSLLRSFFDQSSRRLVLGNEATFQIKIDQHDFSHVMGSVSLDGGKIYLPENRNLIEHLATSFEFNVAHNFFALNDVRIDFCKGQIKCNKVSVLFDSSYGIKMIHAPLVINNLFINWKRDFYGFMYGNLLVNKLPGNDLNLSGTLVLKKALLKDNIFSQSSGSLFAGSVGNFIPIGERLKIDVHVLSEQPIRARTDTLETYASVDVHVRYAHGQNIAQFPQIVGTVSLDKGTLKFLRNKLNIEYGKIQFITNQLNDPMIDLIARNRINKYIVTLQATGSLQKPTIILESTPELTEEQIIGLLLVGSENAKLQTDLFAMLEQNLHNIVLGSKDKLPRATAFLEKLTKPFKYVQITPDFTDQSGRGGIKGTVSVNVNDQVRAQIQKNFNLQEDFSAQVEYFLADDVSIKGVKDQRGELGAEVEFRLKL